MTETQIRTLLTTMTAALPRDWSFLTADQQKATEATYVRMLADLEQAAAYAAVEALLATATRMPTIADIRAATLRAMHGDVRPGGDAWGDVLKLRSYRNVGDVAGVDPVALKVCERMGWIRTRELTRGGVDLEQWCVTTGENESADRARFIELYDQFASTARHEQNVSQLPAAQRFKALKAATQRQLTQAIGRCEQGASQRVDFAKLLPKGDE